MYRDASEALVEPPPPDRANSRLFAPLGIDPRTAIVKKGGRNVKDVNRQGNTKGDDRSFFFIPTHFFGGRFPAGRGRGSMERARFAAG